MARRFFSSLWSSFHRFSCASVLPSPGKTVSMALLVDLAATLAVLATGLTTLSVRTFMLEVTQLVVVVVVVVSMVQNCVVADTADTGSLLTERLPLQKKKKMSHDVCTLGTGVFSLFSTRNNEEGAEGCVRRYAS
jgi:low affinity Fe/Cu permease